jgi:hypothetical protein
VIFIIPSLFILVPLALFIFFPLALLLLLPLSFLVLLHLLRFIPPLLPSLLLLVYLYFIHLSTVGERAFRLSIPILLTIVPISISLPVLVIPLPVTLSVAVSMMVFTHFAVLYFFKVIILILPPLLFLSLWSWTVPIFLFQFLFILLIDFLQARGILLVSLCLIILFLLRDFLLFWVRGFLDGFFGLGLADCLFDWYY